MCLLIFDLYKEIMFSRKSRLVVKSYFGILTYSETFSCNSGKTLCSEQKNTSCQEAMFLYIFINLWIQLWIVIHFKLTKLFWNLFSFEIFFNQIFQRFY